MGRYRLRDAQLERRRDAWMAAGEPVEGYCPFCFKRLAPANAVTLYYHAGSGTYSRAAVDGLEPVSFGKGCADEVMHIYGQYRPAS